MHWPPESAVGVNQGHRGCIPLTMVRPAVTLGMVEPPTCDGNRVRLYRGGPTRSAAAGRAARRPNSLGDAQVV
jgi:hypothetical protein